MRPLANVRTYDCSNFLVTATGVVNCQMTINGFLFLLISPR
jgi:hypothetical protein